MQFSRKSTAAASPCPNNRKSESELACPSARPAPKGRNRIARGVSPGSVNKNDQVPQGRRETRQQPAPRSPRFGWPRWIGRGSCRERGEVSVGPVSLQKKN